jgi:hypothetical protein
MRGASLLLALLLGAASARAEEAPRRAELRATLREALETQAELPVERPRLPEVDASGKSRAEAPRPEAQASSRKQASERAARVAEHTPPGLSVRAAREAALKSAGSGPEAREAAGRSRAEEVRRKKEKPENPGIGRPKQP